MVDHHLNYKYETPSSLSSWSASILFVVQHAIRKEYFLGQEAVVLYAMNTAGLDGSRIFYAPDLIKYYDLKREGYCGTKAPLSSYAQGEYLIHGKLTNDSGLWRAVTLHSLIEAGLWEVYPALEETKLQDSLHVRLIQYRVGTFKRRFENWSFPQHVLLQPYLEVTKCFGGDVEGAVFLALLTCGRRNLQEDEIRKLRDNAKLSITLPAFPKPPDAGQRQALRSLHKKWHGIDEAQQFISCCHFWMT